MGQIENNGSFYPYGTDLDRFKITKCRIDYKCGNCRTEIPSGSFCLGYGQGWNLRTCLNCAEEFLNNAIKSLDNFKQLIKNIKNDLENNKGKYKENNVLVNI